MGYHDEAMRRLGGALIRETLQKENKVSPTSGRGGYVALPGVDPVAFRFSD